MMGVGTIEMVDAEDCQMNSLRKLPDHQHFRPQVISSIHDCYQVSSYVGTSVTCLDPALPGENKSTCKTTQKHTGARIWIVNARYDTGFGSC